MANQIKSVPQKIGVSDRSKEGSQKIISIKSYQESSTSFVSPNFSESRKDSWYYNATEVSNETASTSDQITYNFGTAAGSKEIINQLYVTDRKRYPNKLVSVKKNDVIITSGFTINYSAKTIQFDSANSPSDVVKVSYAYENGSLFELTA